jgi:hypothetical protein
VTPEPRPTIGRYDGHHTEREKPLTGHEPEIAEHERQFREIIEYCPTGIAIVDEDGRLLFDMSLTCQSQKPETSSRVSRRSHQNLDAHGVTSDHEVHLRPLCDTTNERRRNLALEMCPDATLAI